MVSVNLIQYKVLQWHSKVETDPPNDEWKTSASAVEGGGWSQSAARPASTSPH
nr:MAG TPA: hypothetical protein [Caudoviricetes sp.]